MTVSRGKLACVVACGLILFGVRPLGSEEKKKPSPIQQYRSKHFILHTDLPAAEVPKRLERMEATLRQVAKYWSRTPKGLTECYLMHDLDHWKNERLPHRFAVIVVHGTGGVTVNVKSPPGSTQRNAIIYASSRPGIIEHEVAHAYCLSAFGKGGPDWYKEGMAEMAGLDCYGHTAVVCPRGALATFKNSQRRSLDDILNKGAFTNHLSFGFGKLVKDYGGGSTQLPISLWSKRDTAAVSRTRDSYRWSWALCYMLHHNPNYSARFRQLGKGYLTTSRSFNDIFGGNQAEMRFEFDFFMNEFQDGFRIDLCYWDWNKRFRSLGQRRPQVKVKVDAARGFQPSGLLVEKGVVYRYEASGQWQLTANEAKMTATGRAGRGRLVGAVLNDYKLSKPIRLGTKGFFIAPQTGRLYLRCQEAFSKLADNKGSLVVGFALSE